MEDLMLHLFLYYVTALQRTERLQYTIHVWRIFWKNINIDCQVLHLRTYRLECRRLFVVVMFRKWSRPFRIQILSQNPVHSELVKTVQISACSTLVSQPLVAPWHVVAESCIFIPLTFHICYTCTWLGEDVAQRLGGKYWKTHDTTWNGSWMIFYFVGLNWKLM